MKMLPSLGADSPANTSMPGTLIMHYYYDDTLICSQHQYVA